MGNVGDPEPANPADDVILVATDGKEQSLVYFGGLSTRIREEVGDTRLHTISWDLATPSTFQSEKRLLTTSAVARDVSISSAPAVYGTTIGEPLLDWMLMMTLLGF